MGQIIAAVFTIQAIFGLMFRLRKSRRSCFDKLSTNGAPVTLSLAKGDRR